MTIGKTVDYFFFFSFSFVLGLYIHYHYYYNTYSVLIKNVHNRWILINSFKYLRSRLDTSENNFNVHRNEMHLRSDDVYII